MVSGAQSVLEPSTPMTPDPRREFRPWSTFARFIRACRRFAIACLCLNVNDGDWFENMAQTNANLIWRIAELTCGSRRYSHG